jgi:hypothetical protein
MVIDLQPGMRVSKKIEQAARAGVAIHLATKRLGLALA